MFKRAAQRERESEVVVLSILTSNYLHDAGLLDANAVADEVGPLTVEAILDGDIPIRIEVRKEFYGPASVEWHLWPNERGRRTWGTMFVHRLSATKALLTFGSYDRARKPSQRLARVPLPDARWGLTSSHFERFGIETTY